MKAELDNLSEQAIISKYGSTHLFSVSYVKLYDKKRFIAKYGVLVKKFNFFKLSRFEII